MNENEFDLDKYDLQYFDPINISKRIEEDYERYLYSSFPLRESDFHNKLKQELKSKHPYTKDKFFLEFNHKYKNGNKLGDIYIAHTSLRDAFDKFQKEPLYKHQEEALVKAHERKNILISTGTGSGKTEAFLLPIINHLLYEYDQNTLQNKGVRALILYPLNALVNDQLERIQEILNKNDVLKNITFGMYTGETAENDSDKSRINGFYGNFENLIRTREEIRANPPHILITNYSMLEFLLLRPKDLEIFSQKQAKWWQFLVLDEAHVYDGALAIEISMLIRKLKLALNKTDGSLQCIATSATIVDGSTQAGRKDFINFGQTLFGEKFDENSLIFSQKEYDKFFDDTVGEIDNFIKNDFSYKDIYEMLLLPFFIYKDKRFGKSNSIKEEFSKRCQKFAINENDAIEGLSKYFLPDSNKHTKGILDFIKTLEEKNENLIFSMEELSNFLRLEKQETAALVAILNFLSQAKSDYFAFFKIKFHQFVAANTGLFASYKNNKTDKLFFDPTVKTNDDDYVYEIASCMRCGQEYMRGYKQNNAIVRYRDDNKSNELNKDLFAFNIDDIDATKLQEIAEKQKDEYQIESIQKFCLKCNRFYDVAGNKCSCGNELILTLLLHDKFSEFGESKCVRCNAKRVTPFKMGNDAIQSILTMSLYKNLLYKDDKRKLITFADSRKDSSYFPIELEKNFNTFTLRAQLYKKIKEDDGIRLDCLKNLESDLGEQATEEIFRIYERIDLEASGLLRLILTNKDKLLEQNLDCFQNCTIVEFAEDFINSFRLNDVNIFKNLDSETLYKNIGYERIKKENLTNLTIKDKENENILIYSKNISSKLFDKYIDNGFLKLEKSESSYKDFIKQFLSILYFLKIVEVIDETTEDFEYNLENKYCCIENEVGENPDFMRLNNKSFKLIVPDEQTIIYKCKTCGLLQYTNTVCNEKNCFGVVKETKFQDIEDENYRTLYKTLPQNFSLKAEEHSGQLSPSGQRDVQEKFKGGEINILSSSTTFEMGVDLGGLDSVFMRNMPPKTSNYQQRAGRAGRRGRNPFVLTYSRRNTHDMNYFKNDNPKEMISGRIISPIFNITNTKIISRHIYSIALSYFFKEKPEYFYGNEKGPISYNFFIGDGIKTLSKWITDNIELYNKIDTYIETINDQYFDKHLKNEFINARWIDVFKELLDKAKNKFEFEFDSIYKAVENYIVENHSNYTKDDIIKLLTTADGREQIRTTLSFMSLKELANNNIISSLSNYGLVPKYGFPVDVVDLKFMGLLNNQNNWKKYGDFVKKVRLSRDIKYAITEFAPGQEVVVKKRAVKSNKIIVPSEKLKPRISIVCDECRSANFFLTEDNIGNCKYCNQKLNRENLKKFIIPVYGFDVKDEPKTVSKKPKTLTLTEPFVDSNTTTIPREISQGLSISLLKNVDVYLLSNKPYKINIETGEEITRNGRNRSKEDEYRLGALYSTDILEFKISKRYFSSEKINSSIHSTGYALVEGLSQIASIRRDDLDIYAHIYDNDISIYIFDNVPGGAGHTYKVFDFEKEKFKKWLELSYKKIEKCSCDEKSSCFKCLQTRSNQKFHDVLERGLAVETIKNILNGF
jgi:ATP-dependent helicase YprA (DUF1998 family)